MVVRGLLLNRADLRDRESRIIASETRVIKSPARAASKSPVRAAMQSSAQAAVQAGREALLEAAKLASPSKPKEHWALVADANSSVRILARGHIHGKEDIAKWRDQISRDFLSPPKPAAVPKLALPAHTPVPPTSGPPSPNHFERRYGLKRTSVFSPRSSFISPRTMKLTPLSTNGTPRHDALTSSGRAALNIEARTACWKRVRVEDAAGDAHDAAA